MFKRQTVPSKPVHTDADLHHMWLSLRDPWRPSCSRISCVLFDSARVPRPHTVDFDVMASPEPERLSMILDVLEDMIRVVAPGGSVAVQYVSQSASPVDTLASKWLELIESELKARSLDSWPVYAGNGADVWRAETRISA